MAKGRGRGRGRGGGGGGVLLLSLLSLLCLSAASRQGDALDKLHYDAANLRRKAASGSPPSAFYAPFSASRRPVSDKEVIGSKEKDKIVKLPGQPDGVDFDQYAGYVTVDDKAGRALFYYFAEASAAAVNQSSSMPLLLWLNGGPGCSSFGYGEMEELGPLRVASDGRTLFRNPYAWNRVANVLFLESPAGVGFSYSNTTADYGQYGDKKTAADAYAFLLNWMERFPEYKGRDFYIAGESYSGHYVPQLADVIIHNKNRESESSNINKIRNDPVINLRGIMIGNAVINQETDMKGMYDYFWTHALISDSTIKAIHEYCNFSPGAEEQKEECKQAIMEANRLRKGIDIYNIYAPLCSSTLTATPKSTSIDRFDPCSDIYVEAYLNNPKVQRALHANVTKLDHSWSGCSSLVTPWKDSSSTVLPIIRDLLSKEVPVLVYSGDVDGRIPVTSTIYSLNQLNLPISIPWKAWFLNNQVGGYSMTYGDNLTFVTIRGAGHEVPSYQPARALALVDSFLKGTPRPSLN